MRKNNSQLLRIFSPPEGCRPLTTSQGLCSWTPVGVTPPDPDYRLALRAHHRLQGGHQNAPNSFCAGVPPRTPLGHSRRSPAPCRMEIGTSSPYRSPSTPSASRSRRLRHLLVCPPPTYFSFPRALVLFPRQTAMPPDPDYRLTLCARHRPLVVPITKTRKVATLRAMRTAHFCSTVSLYSFCCLTTNMILYLIPPFSPIPVTLTIRQFQSPLRSILEFPFESPLLLLLVVVVVKDGGQVSHVQICSVYLLTFNRLLLFH